MIPNVWKRACNGASACVETRWVTASRCNNGNCVQIGHDGDVILVRDSKNVDGNVLCFAVGAWWSFIAAIKTGQLAIYDGPIRLDQHVTGPWLMSHAEVPDEVLVFDEAEIAAFFECVKAKEFDPDVLAKDGEAPREAPASTESVSGVVSVHG